MWAIISVPGSDDCGMVDYALDKGTGHADKVLDNSLFEVFLDSEGFTTETAMDNAVTIKNSVFADNGDSDDFAIYNVGKLSLEKNTIDNFIYNEGNITSEYTATLIGGKDVKAALGETVTANATLTDDNGNAIYDADFNIAINGVDLVTDYDSIKKIYTAVYTIETAGDNIVSTSYTKATVVPGKYLVDKVNVTEFTVSPGGQGNRIPYGENVTVYVGLYGVDDEGLNETFTVVVNNTEYTVTVVNGTGSFNVSGLESGDYSAQAIFDSNPNYNKAYASGVFSVLRPDRTLSIAVENVELGETAIVNITINKGDESDIGIVVLNINGTEYTVSVEGSVSFEIAGLPIGTHVINAILLADGLDDAVVNDTESITVGDDHEVTVAVIANETISYGENLTVEIGQIISSGLEKVVTGNATIYIYDGDGSTVEPVIAFPCNVGEDGVAVDFKGLSVGNYMIIVDFDSADGYYAGQTTTYATVKQAKSSIVIKPIGEVTYGNDVTIEYTVLNATTIRINVATKDLKPVYYDTFDANVSEYSNSFVLPNLAAGEYIVVVENDGNDNYTFSSTSIEFTVNKAETTMQTEITPDIKVGDEGVVIKVVLPENATGKVMLSIDDEPVSQMGYELINGTANITVPADFVTAGKHSYYVSYDGDDNYTSAYDFKSFEVSKVTPAVNIVLNESEIGVAGSALVNITVAGDATGKLLIDNNGDLSIVELTKGNYTLPLYNLVAGEYYINVTYIGDDKYSGANASKVITVPKADVKIVYETVTPEIKYGESATVKVDIDPDFATGNVTIFVDNIEYETVDLDEDYANATISIFGLAMGSHNITVTYNGDENYNNQTKFSQNAITVTKGQPTIEIMLDNDVIEVGSEISVIYGIWGEVNGGNITISIDGVECYNKPINGTVNYIDILSDLLTAGNHTISAQYLGDDLNLPSNIDKVNVTVLNMSEIKINIDTPENTTDLVFSVTLPSNATGYLFVDVDGQHYYAPVKNGTASVTVPSLAPGNYTAAITYSGDDQYDNVTLTKEVSVASNVPDNAFTIPDTAKDGEPLTYSINLPSDAKGYLEVDVDGKKYVAPLENGSASISVPGLSAGDHNVTVSYTGDGKY
ncbi:MAG: Ig-like domain-containing protein, partial [Methanobrevibacter sp.]|nr:Ig-like domain-containing protein [Methanobrevibacter sp.]